MLRLFVLRCRETFGRVKLYRNFQSGTSPPDHPCGCHQSRDTFQTECLVVDCRVGRGTLQNTLEFDRHFRRKVGKIGRPRMNRTSASRFGGEKTTTILSVCRKLVDRRRVELRLDACKATVFPSYSQPTENLPVARAASPLGR